MAAEPRRDASSEPSQPAGALVLWSVVLGPPILLLANLQLAYMMVPWACVRGARWPLHLVPPVMLLLAGGVALLAWRVWRRAGEDDHGASAAARTRFMAMVGLLSVALFTLAIVAQWIPIFVLGPCQRT